LQVGGGGGGVSILQQSEIEEHALMAAAVRDVEEEEIGEEDSWMFLLPDEVLSAVLARVETVKDRNSFSVVCRRFYEMDRIHRNHLKVGCGLHPAHQALLSLCKRFSHLSSVEIAYSGWLSSDGEQIGDEGLFILATVCTSLTKLSLNFCGFIRDPGFAKLANLGANLEVLLLNFIPGITGMK
jgi:F-box/leucine-rich repeat protein 2/20